MGLPVRLRDEGNRWVEDAIIRDLGLGGACVELAEDDPSVRPGAPLVLEVNTPSLWDPLVLRGRVAWVRRRQGDGVIRAGMRFEHPDQGGLFALFQLLGAQSFE